MGEHFKEKSGLRLSGRLMMILITGARKRQGMVVCLVLKTFHRLLSLFKTGPQVAPSHYFADLV